MTARDPSPAPPLPDELLTERLRLRPVRDADLPFFVDLHGDRRVVRFLGGDGTPRTPEMTRDWLALMQSWYVDHQVGTYAIERRSDGRLVGRGGVTIFEVEREASAADGVPLATWGVGSAPAGTAVRQVVEIGYVVHPDAWGNGYAPEAARRWMDWAFEVRDEPRITSFIHADNLASARVAEKNGLSTDGARVRMEGREYLWYRKERDGDSG